MKKVKNLGIVYIICSAFCFACMNLFVRLSGDLPSFQKSFFRNLVAVIFAILIIKKNKVNIEIKKEAYVPLFLRSFIGTIGILCNFYAIDHMVIADASMLNKLSPFFMLICSYIILKERVKAYQGICIAVAFLGSLFVIKPTTDMFGNPAAIIGIMGGLSAGLAYTYVRVCSKRGVQGPVIVAVFSGFSCISLLPVLVIQYKAMGLDQLLLLLMAGLCAAGGQFAVTAAYSYAPAKEVSIYDNTQLIFATILGFLFLNEFPDMYSFLGYIIIIGASITMFILNKKHQEGEK